MCLGLFPYSSFLSTLLKFDKDLADQIRAKGCPWCKGKLHSARYRRKPRGGPEDLDESFCWRFSFCCDKDGCRKRATPPSIRFLGPKVSLACIVVLSTAMQQGLTPWRASKLQNMIGVSIKTLKRWREFWQTCFVQSTFWRGARARFANPVDIQCFPLSLLEEWDWQKPNEQALQNLLEFIKPCTTHPWLDCQAF